MERTRVAVPPPQERLHFDHCPNRDKEHSLSNSCSNHTAATRSASASIASTAAAAAAAKRRILISYHRTIFGACKVKNTEFPPG
jgi:hypothetical protein